MPTVPDGEEDGEYMFEDEQLKSIPICDLFYRIAMDTTRPLLKTK